MGADQAAAAAVAGQVAGPRPGPDRHCLQGILFVLHTGIGWEDLPLELGFGSGMTCWRRLKRWTDAGVFDQLHQILLAQLNAANRIDWSRAAVDGRRCAVPGRRVGGHIRRAERAVHLYPGAVCALLLPAWLIGTEGGIDDGLSGMGVAGGGRHAPAGA